MYSNNFVTVGGANANSMGLLQTTTPQNAPTNRTYASGGMHSVLAACDTDKKATLKIKSINKSLGKLDQISQLNWSKKDFRVEAVATGNQVFNRVHTTVDPKTFSHSAKEHSVVDACHSLGATKLSKDYNASD